MKATNSARSGNLACRLTGLPPWFFFIAIVAIVFLPVSEPISGLVYFIFHVGYVFAIATALATHPMGGPLLPWHRFVTMLSIVFLVAVACFTVVVTGKAESVSYLLALGAIAMLGGLVYCHYVVARALVLADGKQRTKDDTWGEPLWCFVMLWVLPVGIWWVQKRVRNLFGGPPVV